MSASCDCGHLSVYTVRMGPFLTGTPQDDAAVPLFVELGKLTGGGVAGGDSSG